MVWRNCREALMTPTIIDKKFSKIYLKECRGKKNNCIHQFFTTQPNKLYCSAWCRHEAIRDKGRKRVAAFRKKYKNEGTGPKVPNWIGTNSNFKEEYEIPDPTYLGIPIQFYNESLSINDMKNETFVTCTSEGEHSPIPSLSYQGVTHDDLHAFSISYLKDNQVKCPECENKQNWIEHALNICSQCGLVIKAPPIHPGYIVDDLLPKKKVAPTVQDLNLTQDLKGAHELAYTKYQEQIAVIDEEVEQNDLLNFDDNDPLNPVYWRNRKQKKCKQI